MRCPTLKEAPIPAEDRVGWPWTQESLQLPDTMPNGKPWPRISIVTPNYNYGRFIEETIRSVLLQGYPELEYIIIDGGSTDGSVGIIKKYERWLAYWVTEKDKGQASAINKGFTRSSGGIFNWINSDDQLLPGALCEIAMAWNKKQSHFIIGGALTIDASSGVILHHWQPRISKSPLNLIKVGQFGEGMAQPSNFLSRSLFKDMGYLREDLNYVFDLALYLKTMVLLRSRLKITTIPAIISRCLSHPEAKTVKEADLFIEEAKRILSEMRLYFFWIERLGISYYLKKNELQRLITQILINDERRLWRLICLSFRYPYVCLSRFFWGALKKVLMD